jgi:hypothetical protein
VQGAPMQMKMRLSLVIKMDNRKKHNTVVPKQCALPFTAH